MKHRRNCSQLDEIDDIQNETSHPAVQRLKSFSRHKRELKYTYSMQHGTDLPDTMVSSLQAFVALLALWSLYFLLSESTIKTVFCRLFEMIMV